MLGIYLPILVLLGVAIAFGLGSVVFSSLIGEKKITPVKVAPYECGCEPIGTARERFSIKFYLIAISFPTGGNFAFYGLNGCGNTI